MNRLLTDSQLSTYTAGTQKKQMDVLFFCFYPFVQDQFPVNQRVLRPIRNIYVPLINRSSAKDCFMVEAASLPLANLGSGAIRVFIYRVVRGDISRIYELRSKFRLYRQTVPPEESMISVLPELSRTRRGSGNRNLLILTISRIYELRSKFRLYCQTHRKLTRNIRVQANKRKSCLT